jgi:putative ABC transport system permease protein
VTATTAPTAALDGPGLVLGKGDGGLAARRAVSRWAWRLFKREWRQQVLILALVVVAVAATVVAAAVATDTPPPKNAGFGSAQDLATFQGSSAQLSSDIKGVQRRFGAVDVIENQTLEVPGSISTYQIRSQNPHGEFGGPMLSLVSGSWPTGADQVALTSGLASELGGLTVGDTWHHAGQDKRVVGVVENPQSLLDEFALVAPGQISGPAQATVLFDARGVDVSALGSNYQALGEVQQNAINPETIVLAASTLGILLIALVAIGGFTVLAQRRLRSIGMLASLGATDENIGLVIKANGAVVGVVGTAIGFVIGLGLWLAYRPHLESSSHHLIGVLALPWAVIVPAMVIAVVATLFAASRPARSMRKVPIVAALSGRPAPPKQIRRSAVPGILVLVIGFLLLGSAGASRGGGGAPQLLFGLIALVIGLILLAPMFLTSFAKLFTRSPISVRMAVRDLARYRSRSGSALSAISLAVLVAVMVCVVAASRYGNVLDYVGPNLAPNQLALYNQNGPYGPGGPGDASAVAVAPASSIATMSGQVQSIAKAIGANQVIELESTSASLQHEARGRQFTGPVYVATPQLLSAFGIKESSIDPNADILTMRPGLASLSKMQLDYGNYFSGKGGPPPSNEPFPCPAHSCVANPVIQQVDSLPSGTSAPNTVVTEHAVKTLGLQPIVGGWLLQSSRPFTASQIDDAQAGAAADGMSIEQRNDQPTSAVIINWATVFGILIALAILAMSVGLIRSETASDLRTLSATGASSLTRRALSSATAGSLALLGAVLGTVIGYLGVIGYLRSNSLDGLGSLNSIPVQNLLLILFGMPLVAAGVGWLLAGRDPMSMAQQPLE